MLPRLGLLPVRHFTASARTTSSSSPPKAKRPAKKLSDLVVPISFVSFAVLSVVGSYYLAQWRSHDPAARKLLPPPTLDPAEFEKEKKRPEAKQPAAKQPAPTTTPQRLI